MNNHHYISYNHVCRRERNTETDNRYLCSLAKKWLRLEGGEIYCVWFYAWTWFFRPSSDARRNHSFSQLVWTFTKKPTIFLFSH